MSNQNQIEALKKEQSSLQAKLRAATHRQKYLESAEKKLTWKERTHRLCTRGGMLEKFLIEPGSLTDDQVMEILKSAFRRDEVTALIHSFLRENIQDSNIQETSTQDV